MALYLLADVGSTWTKLTAVDDTGSVAARASAPTTVSTDIMQGFNAALMEIRTQAGSNEDKIYACSSAAGGLAMIACGLVPDLTGQAARLAVLGAGAKVLRVYGYNLNRDDVKEIESIRPDILLLAGGTDGGNKRFLLENAQALAENVSPLPVVLAGNRNAVYEASEMLEAAGFSVEITGNVMPELNKLDIEPARESIRNLFLRHIVRAKGMETLSRQLAAPLIPTPAAVLAAGKLLARETGQLMMVDVGGATTDVYSYGGVEVPTGMMRKGLEPPWDMRTVEADIGMRYSLSSLVQQAGLESILALAPQEEPWQEELEKILASPGRLVRPGLEGLETNLARAAVRISVSRHAGTVERIYSPTGFVDVLTGKDLRGMQTMIGVGGVMVNSPDPRGIVAIGNEGLLPENPRLMLDSNYIMAAAGLLAASQPRLAGRMLADSLATL
ncbi:MAG TPA: hypothetical protein DEA85_03180 [Firmicutes bacterium]|nr:hypothetical protein [Bacillota bacterium]